MMFFFFNDTATTEIYTLSLHDALPIFKIRVDPRRRENSTGGRNVVRGCDRFTGGERAKILIVRDAAVELTEKFTTVARVIFPGIFAVEEDANRERIRTTHHIREIAEFPVQVRSG